MKAHVSSILLGVRDMDRAKRFYTEGLGWKIQSDFGVSVFFASDGASPSVSTAARAWPTRWARTRKAAASADWF
ncbi:VOC family protein [Streptomyces sp. NPDC048560]|uniref:VOC family protein n=1 Tax=Streptomyces sp. NPDC048560 TaxID=3155488 RepID=UPI0034199E84